MSTAITPPTPSTPSQNPRELLKKLQEQYAVFRECRPLAIGIDKQILSADPQIERKALRIALGIHTNSNRYLKAMKEATARFDLNGNQAGDVPEEHRKRAKDMLQERFKKAAEMKKAQREAEEAERHAEEAKRRSEEKLAQLAAKFSRK